MTAPRTATLAELARMSGKTHTAVSKQMKRHGVPHKGKGYDTEKALAAMALGAQLDKSKTEAELGKMKAAGIDEGSIVYKSKLAQYRKTVLQGDILESERDQIRGKLADVDEIANRFTRILADMAQRLGTWRESSIAKKPHLRKEIEDCYRTLQSALAEAGDE
jgi:activator of 2-hydroxyglutaryl-CoA dehydratase